MGWSLVAGHVHYATDTLAGLGIALAVIPLLGWCTDRAGDLITADRWMATPV